jgi:hypothetical protein
MVPLDDKTVSELKLAQAQLFHRFLAADSTWDNFQSMYNFCKHLLPLRKVLQDLARRHETNATRFCEKVMGRHWFKPSNDTSPRQAKALLKILPRIPMFPAARGEISKLDSKLLLRQLQALASRPGGRKPLGIYAEALALRKTNPPLSFHEICRRLNPAYAGMNSAAKRSERERIRSGVTRLVKKTVQQSKRVTK